MHRYEVRTHKLTCGISADVIIEVVAVRTSKHCRIHGLLLSVVKQFIFNIFDERKRPVAGLVLHSVEALCLIFAVHISLDDLVGYGNGLGLEVDVASFQSESLAASESIVSRKQYGNVYGTLPRRNKQVSQLVLTVK